VTTLDDIITDLVMAGADRAAVVRDESEPSIIVLMLSREAGRQLGAAIAPVIGAYGTYGDDFPVTLQTAITDIFRVAEQSRHAVIDFDLDHHRLAIFGIVFVGHEACAAAAAVCNAHGAPCSLDRVKPAPGYDITKRLQR
jgi:hypothetical protein